MFHQNLTAHCTEAVLVTFLYLAIITGEGDKTPHVQISK
jgi:hypothetical protein